MASFIGKRDLQCYDDDDDDDSIQRKTVKLDNIDDEKLLQFLSWCSSEGLFISKKVNSYCTPEGAWLRQKPKCSRAAGAARVKLKVRFRV